MEGVELQLEIYMYIYIYIYCPITSDQILLIL